MVTRFSAFARDSFIATGLSAFTEAEIEDLSAVQVEQAPRLANFILNAMARGRPKRPDYRFWFLFHRRVGIAVEEFELARTHTLHYLDGRRDDESNVYGPYFIALHHWEQYLSAAWQSFNTLNELIRTMGDAKVRLFERGDETVLARLNCMHNTAKHAEERIAEGRVPDAGNITVWLANDGLHCTETSLSYGELAEVTIELATWSLALEDPRGSKQRLHDLMTLQSRMES